MMSMAKFIQGELDANGRTLSGWMYTDATTTTPCPRCGVSEGVFCKTPKGRNAVVPHGERMKAYQNAIGPEESARRHFRTVEE